MCVCVCMGSECVCVFVCVQVLHIGFHMLYWEKTLAQPPRTGPGQRIKPQLGAKAGACCSCGGHCCCKHPQFNMLILGRVRNVRSLGSIEEDFLPH